MSLCVCMYVCVFIYIYTHEYSTQIHTLPESLPDPQTGVHRLTIRNIAKSKRAKQRFQGQLLPTAGETRVWSSAKLTFC